MKARIKAEEEREIELKASAMRYAARKAGKKKAAAERFNFPFPSTRDRSDF